MMYYIVFAGGWYITEKRSQVCRRPQRVKTSRESSESTGSSSLYLRNWITICSKTRWEKQVVSQEFAPLHVFPDIFWYLQCYTLDDIQVFPKKEYPKMDGLWWKTLLKWMIWGYHYFRKHPYIVPRISRLTKTLVAWWIFAPRSFCHLRFRSRWGLCFTTRRQEDSGVDGLNDWKIPDLYGMLLITWREVCSVYSCQN